MTIHDFSAKQIFWSNLLLIVCCACYLAWWILAFKPTGVRKGMKSGWILLPAFAAGLAAVILAEKGVLSAPIEVTLFPRGLLFGGGISSYLILLAVTRLFFGRQVTTELLLMVGWAVMALSEINALYGVGIFPRELSVVFVVVILVVTLISLVCYLLYYNLGDCAGYFDGMVPLFLAALVMAGISAAMLLQ